MSSQVMAGKVWQGLAGRLNPTSLHYTFYSEEGEQKRTYFRLLCFLLRPSTDLLTPLWIDFMFTVFFVEGLTSLVRSIYD